MSPAIISKPIKLAVHSDRIFADGWVWVGCTGVDYCDGSLPGRITLPTFKSRVDIMHRYAYEKGCHPVVAGAILASAQEVHQ